VDCFAQERFTIHLDLDFDIACIGLELQPEIGRLQEMLHSVNRSGN